MSKVNRLTLFACVLSAGAYTQTQAQTQSSASTPAKPAAEPKSAGLINDWLRQESKAFNPWDFGGQVRLRYEAFEEASPAFPTMDFQKEGVSNDNGYFWTRERLHLGYNSSWFKFYSEGQNSTSTGDNDPRNTGQDTFDLHQAYVTVGNLKEFPLTATVGRQEFIYGDERLVGASDWSNTARAFDAAKLRFENEAVTVDAFGGRVVLTDDSKFDVPDYHDWFSGLYASSKKLVPIQETQLYFLARNSSTGAAVTPRNIYSIGARVKSLPGKLKGWDYGAEAVGQLGDVTQSGRVVDQRAYAFALLGGYTFKDVALTPRVGLEYDYSSGDSDPNDGKSQTLDNLFPTNHKHYGIMDLVGWRNIHDVRLNLTVKPIKKLTVAVDYHMFWLADTHDFFYPQGGSGRNGLGYGRNSSYDSYLGSEVDIDVNYPITPWLAFRGGYGHFFTGSYIDSSKASRGGSTDSDWVYIQGTLNF